MLLRYIYLPFFLLPIIIPRKHLEYPLPCFTIFKRKCLFHSRYQLKKKKKKIECSYPSLFYSVIRRHMNIMNEFRTRKVSMYNTT